MEKFKKGKKEYVIFEAQEIERILFDAGLAFERCANLTELEDVEQICINQKNEMTRLLDELI